MLAVLAPRCNSNAEESCSHEFPTNHHRQSLECVICRCQPQPQPQLCTYAVHTKSNSPSCFPTSSPPYLRFLIALKKFITAHEPRISSKMPHYITSCTPLAVSKSGHECIVILQPCPHHATTHLAASTPPSISWFVNGVPSSTQPQLNNRPVISSTTGSAVRLVLSYRDQ